MYLNLMPRPFPMAIIICSPSYRAVVEALLKNAAACLCTHQGRNAEEMKKTIAVILTAITIVVSVIIFSVKCNRNQNTTTGILIEREHWGAPNNNLSENLRFNKHPIHSVIVGQTDTNSCDTIEYCSNLVKVLQEHFGLEQGTDLPYNFLIGGDGNAYVVRGWDFHSQQERNNSIFIAFIGDYDRDQLSTRMIKTAKSLLHLGVEKGKLSRNYTLVCQNQTSPMKNPGANVYEIVKKWAHFSREDYTPAT